MINITLLRNEETREATIKALEKRGVSLDQIMHLIEADRIWLKISQMAEESRAKQRKLEKVIATLPPEERKKFVNKMQNIIEDNEKVQLMLSPATIARHELIALIPNIPLPDVQAGGEADSEVIAESETKPKDSASTPTDYMALMGSRIDMQRAAKVSGARFTYLSGDLARLEFGIVSFVLDRLAGQGFTQVVPPVLIQERAMAGMGYLEQAGEEVYKTQDNLYLVGTSEQSLGTMHMGEILPIAQLPLRYAAFSPCFRREAGSHGKDVKGILRLHQFDKVEMFSITTPEKSEEEHQFLLSQQRRIMDDFQLPYRVVRLAAGDLGGPSAKTYDIETWIPSEGTYRETHSTSNTTDYQSRRLNIRYKNAENKSQKVHMLNGTAVAVTRILIALIENHQQKDGSVALPACLHPYLPFESLA